MESNNGASGSHGNSMTRTASNSVSGTATHTMTEEKKKLLVLKLREKRVKWDESAVNNEFMGKKSSKSNLIPVI
jgi:hypothetical protein